MNANERLMKLATASPAVLAAVDAALAGRATPRLVNKECRLVTYTEAAQLLNLSRQTVYKLVKQGRLETVPINGARRIRLSSIHDF